MKAVTAVVKGHKSSCTYLSIVHRLLALAKRSSSERAWRREPKFLRWNHTIFMQGSVRQSSEKWWRDGIWVDKLWPNNARNRQSRAFLRLWLMHSFILIGNLTIGEIYVFKAAWWGFLRTHSESADNKVGHEAAGLKLFSWWWYMGQCPCRWLLHLLLDRILKVGIIGANLLALWWTVGFLNRHL